MFSKNLLLPCLLDIYGALLTDRKRELLDYYYEEDYSLSEISELTGISRQGIRDSVKKSEALLLDYEEKLGLYAKKKAAQAALSKASGHLSDLHEEGRESGFSQTLSSLEEAMDTLTELLS